MEDTRFVQEVGIASEMLLLEYSILEDGMSLERSRMAYVAFKKKCKIFLAFGICYWIISACVQVLGEGEFKVVVLAAMVMSSFALILWKLLLMRKEQRIREDIRRLMILGIALNMARGDWVRVKILLIQLEL